MESWEGFQMSEIKPEVVKYPLGLLLRQKNGGARYLKFWERVRYRLFGTFPDN